MTTQEYMNFILKHHVRIRADIAMLEHELTLCETEDETIEALAFQAQDYGNKVQSSIRQDATSRIALIYKKERDRAIRSASSREAASMLLDASRKAIVFLDLAFAQLRAAYPKLYDMVDALYTKGRSWEEYKQEAGLSSYEQISRLRKKTIEVLSDWWDGKRAMKEEPNGRDEGAGEDKGDVVPTDGR